MRLLQIEATNFLSHKRTCLEIPKGFIGVIGLNGSGKSSLIKDAVTWALWGRSRVSGAGDELIRVGTSLCSVTISFSVGTVVYHVTRKRIRGTKTELFLEDNVCDLSKPTIKATQEEINRVLGMNYDVFVNSCCIEQGESGSFSNLDPSQAAMLLSKILQLDFYADCKVKATDKTVLAKMKTDKCEAANMYLQKKIDEFKQTESILKKKQNMIILLRSSLESFNIKYGQAQTQYNNVYAKWQKNSTVAKLIEHDLSRANDELIDLRNKTVTIEDIADKCPVCTMEMNAESKKILTQNMLDKYHILLEDASILKAQLKEARNTHRVLMEHLKTYKLEEKRTKIKSMHSQIDTLAGEITSLQNITSDIEESKEKLEQNSKEIAKYKKVESIYSELAYAFGPKGIPLMIVDNVLQELEVLINNNIALLSDLPISVELRTQRESIKGDMIDTFQIMITEGLSTRGYFNYSGGEKMVIDVALRLGLSELLARRNNFKVETLIIDEGLGSLDEENQKNLINTLKKLENKFSNILVITHTQAKDYFTNVLEVTKVNGVSKLDKHGSVWYTNNRVEI